MCFFNSLIFRPTVHASNTRQNDITCSLGMHRYKWKLLFSFTVSHMYCTFSKGLAAQTQKSSRAFCYDSSQTVHYGMTPCPPLRHIKSLWNESAGLTVLGIPPPLSEQAKGWLSPQVLCHIQLDGFDLFVDKVQELIQSKNRFCPPGTASIDGVKRWRVLSEVIFRSQWLVCPHRVIVALYWVSAHLCSCQHGGSRCIWDLSWDWRCVRVKVHISELCEYCLNALLECMCEVNGEVGPVFLLTLRLARCHSARPFIMVVTWSDSGTQILPVTDTSPDLQSVPVLYTQIHTHEHAYTHTHTDWQALK